MQWPHHNVTYVCKPVSSQKPRRISVKIELMSESARPLKKLRQPSHLNSYIVLLTALLNVTAHLEILKVTHLFKHSPNDSKQYQVIIERSSDINAYFPTYLIKIIGLVQGW